VAANVFHVTDGVQNWLGHRRHLVGTQALLAEEPVDRLGRDGRKKLALGIGPRVRVSGLQQHGTRRDQRE
jgi:hypothetical protein